MRVGIKSLLRSAVTPQLQHAVSARMEGKDGVTFKIQQRKMATFQVSPNAQKQEAVHVSSFY